MRKGNSLNPAEFVFPDNNLENAAPDAGFFTWDVPDNLIYADGALAHLFGIDEDDAEQGLPIEIYLARVHPEDQPHLAKAIRDSIVEHTPQQEFYRVRNAENHYVSVMSFGKGFRDKNGVPIRYVGIVVPAAEPLVEARCH